MAIDIEEAVRAFMKLAGQLPDNPGKYAMDLRIALLDEEFSELIEALNHGDRVQIAKELCDLVYVVVGTSIALNIPFDACFSALQVSNLSKFDSEEPEVRSDGKILKGKNYTPAEDAIREILG